MIKNHRIWLAVPPEEKDEAIKAHPRLNNGQNAIVWDPEQRLWYANPGVELNKFERWLPQPQNLSMSSDDPVSEFAQVLENAGLVLKGLPVMDGATHRVPTKADKNGVKSGVYKGYLDGRPAGWYRDYRSSEAKATNWTFSGGADADPRTKLHLRAQAQQNREDSARALALQYNTQAGYATRYVNSLPQATESEYLTRKGVLAAPGVRITPKQDLVVPFSNAEGQIRSYQRIPPTGGKDARILKNSEKTGNWFTFGSPQNGKPVLFAEGYSTAASIHEATGLPVLMTVDAGNMIAVAENARTVWPDSKFIFCADNDHQLKNQLTGEPENKGILSATRAAELTNGEVIAPAFTQVEIEQNLTDFNDMILSRGKDLARHLINVQLHAIGVETPFNTDAQTRNAFVEGGLVFTPIQETAMDNQESPDIAQTSVQDTAPQSTASELAKATAAGEAATAAPVRPPELVANPLTPENVPTASPDNPGLAVPESVPTAGTDNLEPAAPEPALTAGPDNPEPVAPEPVPTKEQNKQETTPESETPEQPLPDPTPVFTTKSAVNEPFNSATSAPEKESPAGEPHRADDEADAIVYAPRRPDAGNAPAREDMDKIIKGLSWEDLSNNSRLFRLDGQDAFLDMGNRLEMCNGASEDDRKVLAALSVAGKFYGGVIELTGSEAFKEKAMRLIIDYDLDIRMKLPNQRDQLETLRKQMSESRDSVVTHMPTPDLNRHTPTGGPEPVRAPSSEMTSERPAGPVSTPVPPVPPVPPQNVTAVPSPRITTAEQTSSLLVAEEKSQKSAPAVTEEPAPAALNPGQSVTAVLVNHGAAVYENGEKRGGSYFIELKNRSGSHVYWGQDLRDLVQNLNKGDVVTLTLDSRDTWKKDGEKEERVKNNWSLVPAATGMAVPHTQPEQGQQLQSFPVDTFGKITQQIRQSWPEYTQELKLPPRLEDRNFYLREDRHPVQSPAGNAIVAPPTKGEPVALTPVMASMNPQTQQVDLLLVRSAGEHLQGVVRLNNTLYPALATPTADNQQLVINAVTDKGLRYAGYGQAINFEPDGTTRTEPQLMKFQLKGQEEDAPVNARLYTPERQDDALFQQLGFEQSWKQWDESRKQEGRQELNHHQDHSHAPGR